MPVELSQAGQQLRCDCGATVSVPTFRQLRDLPVATAEPAQAASPRTWGARQGAIAANLIVAALLVIAAGASRYFEPLLPQFNPAARNQLVSGEIDKFTPAEAWKIWTENYRQLSRTGFTAMEHPQTAALQRDIDQHRRIQFALLALAAFCASVAGVLWLTGGRK
jgi:hypothetical protein